MEDLISSRALVVMRSLAMMHPDMMEQALRKPQLRKWFVSRIMQVMEGQAPIGVVEAIVDGQFQKYAV